MSAPTRRALLARLATTPLLSAVPATLAPGAAARAAAGPPPEDAPTDGPEVGPPTWIETPARVRPGHPVRLRLAGAEAVQVSAGPGVEGFAPREFPVTAGTCDFNAPVLVAEGFWAELVCTPLLRDGGGALRPGSAVTVRVLALGRHFGG